MEIVLWQLCLARTQIWVVNTRCGINLVGSLKCLWHEMFCYLVRKSFQNDEEWHLFYCDSTLGCQVIQDFD